MPTYTDPAGVTGIRSTPRPLKGQTVSGYGGAVPTGHMIRYLGVWRRVFAMSYGNAPTLYVRVRGADHLLDDATARRLTNEESNA